MFTGHFEQTPAKKGLLKISWSIQHFSIIIFDCTVVLLLKLPRTTHLLPELAKAQLANCVAVAPKECGFARVCTPVPHPHPHTENLNILGGDDEGYQGLESE